MSKFLVKIQLVVEAESATEAMLAASNEVTGLAHVDPQPYVVPYGRWPTSVEDGVQIAVREIGPGTPYQTVCSNF